MSYQKTNWKNGDVITAEKLNNIEDGIAGASGMLVVNSTIDENTLITGLDKTWQEIYDAMLTGGAIVNEKKKDMEGNITGQRFVQVRDYGYSQDDSGSTTYFIDLTNNYTYVCSTPNEYPVMRIG